MIYRKVEYMGRTGGGEYILYITLIISFGSVYFRLGVELDISMCMIFLSFWWSYRECNLE